MSHCAIGKRWNGSAESRNLSMRRNFNRENRETLPASNDGQQPSSERSVNAQGGNADMHAEHGHACGGSFASTFPVRRLSTLIRKSVFTIELRQEPYEVILHARICAGDGQQWPFRGGSNWNTSDNCRSANRNNNSPDNHNDNIGFRPALQLSRVKLFEID